MEIPPKLRNLYRHWKFHTKTTSPGLAPSTLFKNNELFKEISWFIHERIKIWKNKNTGKPPPYTKDPILLRYRFCNVFREFDKQTVVFHTLLNPLRNEFSLWLLNMYYYRMVARPETIKATGALSFDARKNKKLYRKLMNSPRPRFGTPYVFPISVIQKSKTPTRELFLTVFLPNIMKDVAEEIMMWNKKSVYDGVQSIITIFGFNLYFLWTEVLIDVAYQFPQYIDLFGRFPVGPGSISTLRKIDAGKDPSLLVQDLSLMNINLGLTYKGKTL